MGMTMNPNTSEGLGTPAGTVTPASVPGGAINQGLANSAKPPMSSTQNGLPTIGSQAPTQPFMTNSAFFPKQDQNTMEVASEKTQI